MHAYYRQGGIDRRMAPRIVYPEAACPHPGWANNMQAIDFRLEDHGRAIHDPLVRSSRNDTGFAGESPSQGMGPFHLRAKLAITRRRPPGSLNCRTTGTKGRRSFDDDPIGVAAHLNNRKRK